MPYIETGSPQRSTGNPGISDVYHSPNVFANNVEIALWKEAADTAAFLLKMSSPEVSYVLEQADVDSIDEASAASAATGIQLSVDAGIASGVMSAGTTAPSALPLNEDGSVVTDTTPPAVTGGHVLTVDWSKFTADNIPYDTLMLTPLTSLATFTTKAGLWNNQPKPLGPHTRFSGSGDNKFIIEQDYYQGGVKKGRITVPQILHNLANLAQNIYEPIKAKYPSAIITNTFRQSPPGGQKQQAQHGLGMAMDIQFPGTPTTGYYDIAVWIRDNLPIDQLLQEKAGGTVWIHVSHYSGFGYQVPAASKVANCIVSPTFAFIPGLSRLA